MFKDLSGLFKQVQGMQTKFTEMQEQLARIEVEGNAGAGMIRLTLSGSGDISALHIDAARCQELMQEQSIEIIEDLIIAAHKDAKTRLDQTLQEKMQEIGGGLPLPQGMKLF